MMTLNQKLLRNVQSMERSSSVSSLRSVGAFLMKGICSLKRKHLTDVILQENRASERNVLIRKSNAA